MDHDFRPVARVRPAAPYIGGKKHLAERIAKAIEMVPHVTYAEPFVGMGGVFFRRRWAPQAEVINDLSHDVATLFRILQRHYPQFLETLKFQITSRSEFERLAAVDPDTLTDLERAARFLYLQRTAFGGKVTGRSFGTACGAAGRFDTTKLGPILEAIHERLAGVVIECLSWREFIPRYDRADTLFYIDPPYYGSESDYGAGAFRRTDFADLVKALAGIEGAFILSINDVPQTRDLFSAFDIEGVTTRYTIAAGDSAEAKELIVRGPRLERFARPQDLLSGMQG